jgi:hypothetical protein
VEIVVDGDTVFHGVILRIEAESEGKATPSPPNPPLEGEGLKATLEEWNYRLFCAMLVWLQVFRRQAMSIGQSLLAALLVLALSSCASMSGSPSVAEDGALKSGADAMETGTGHTASVTVVGIQPGIPPLQRLLVDVPLSNRSSSPCWVLLPSNLPLSSGGVDVLEQIEATTVASKIVVGRLLGTGGRYALRLNPGARVALRGLEVGLWQEPGPAGAELDVLFADDVSLGGETMASWFDREPGIDGTVEVDMRKAPVSDVHRTRDGKEVAVAIVGAWDVIRLRATMQHTIPTQPTP